VTESFTSSPIPPSPSPSRVFTGSIPGGPAASGGNAGGTNWASGPDTAGTATRRNTSSTNWWETEVRPQRDCAMDTGSPHRKHRQVGCEALASGFSTGSDQVTHQARKSAHKKTKYE
jgi:hypothetical protein